MGIITRLYLFQQQQLNKVFKSQSRWKGIVKYGRVFIIKSENYIKMSEEPALGLNKSAELRKTRYFQKYRNELDKVSGSLKRSTTMSPTVINMSKYRSRQTLPESLTLKPPQLMKIVTEGQVLVSRKNTEGQNSLEMRMEKTESIQLNKKSEGEEGQSSINIQTFGSVESEVFIPTKKAENPSPSIESSLIEQESPILMKGTGHITVEHPEIMRKFTPDPDLYSKQFTFTNIDIDESAKSRKLQGFQDAIYAFSSQTQSPQIPKQKGSQDRLKEEPKSSGRPNSRKKEEPVQDVDILLQQYELIREKIEKADIELYEKRGQLSRLVIENQGMQEKDYNRNIVNYAQTILDIEQKIKQTKKIHEVQLAKLSEFKKEIHEENIELSQKVDTIEEQVEHFGKQYEILDGKYSNKHLENKSSKLQNEIGRLDVEKELAEKKKNSSQELEDISFAQFRKYSDAWKKKILGREVKLAEERIKFSDKQKYQKDIQKKSILLKDKKIEIQLRKKNIQECNKVIDHLEKTIRELRLQNKEALRVTERKIPALNYLTTSQRFMQK